MNVSEVAGGHHAVEFAVNMLDRHDLIDTSAPTLVQVGYTLHWKCFFSASVIPFGLIEKTKKYFIILETKIKQQMPNSNLNSITKYIRHFYTLGVEHLILLFKIF